ncbi:PIN domain-containing protein [Fuchsiella alkaliacetigena]|uniref:PIN domain-containing protein n=1 Tax=Fuchsiella alkaliacetigena TaxID=957042 RepID=UPI002009F61E|nr:PIN domain-containing protein [Fuchsiella alkaliacetigena]MCK8824321.1 PIN domain-containing protein [Fuchsiella alkaliacetigena]
MKIIDANVILRYLLDDVEELADKASEIIEKDRVYILNEVLAEVIYVLEGVYELDRKEIKDVLFEFLGLETVVIEDKKLLFESLEKYLEIKLDFVDCLLYAYVKVNNRKVYTFDKKLNQEINKLNKNLLDAD